MPIRRFALENQPYHTISVTSGRKPILAAPNAARILMSAIEFERRENRAFVLAYAILPDHLHLLLVPRSPHDLSGVLHHLKSYAAKEINKALGRTGPVWQAGFYDRAIRNEAHLESTVEYIHRNPVVAGLASSPEDYEWCSAHLYAPVDVEAFLGG